MSDSTAVHALNRCLLTAAAAMGVVWATMARQEQQQQLWCVSHTRAAPAALTTQCSPQLQVQQAPATGRHLNLHSLLCRAAVVACMKLCWLLQQGQAMRLLMQVSCAARLLRHVHEQNFISHPQTLKPQHKIILHNMLLPRPSGVPSVMTGIVLLNPRCVVAAPRSMLCPPTHTHTHLLSPARLPCLAERLVAALSAGPDHASSTSGDTSSSSVSKPGSLSFAAPGASGPGGEAPSITPTLGPRTQPRTRSWQQADSQAVGAGPPAAAPHSVSSSSVRASLQSVGPSSSGQGDGQDDVLGPVGVSSSGQQLQARYLEPSGRVSSELTRSSSATSEELEHLLHQLSQYEEHLLEEAQAVSRGGGGGGQQGGQQAAQQPQQHQQQPGEVRASVDSSLSWSQTLAGLTHLLPPEN